MPTTYTPIRYPGGKTKIYPVIRAILEANDLIGCAYHEAFAGGAGLAVKLLMKGDVSSITINDYDRSVFCMWNAIVNESESMCSFIEKATLDVDTWKQHREIYRNRDNEDPLQLAKSTFYLNRTNVSGILDGGLIGGIEQKGNFKMDARFNKATLVRKIRAIAKLRDKISVTYLDAEQFIEERLHGIGSFAYFDPPYVQKGPGLYKNAFTEEKHRSLARKIAQCDCKWVVTYDADKLIDDIYSDFAQSDLAITYTANTKTTAKEKLILGPGLKWSQF